MKPPKADRNVRGVAVMTDADRRKGAYKKYRVERLNDPKNKHIDCEYFVLDLIHDKFAWAALKAYADACSEEYPLLASDIRKGLPDPEAKP